MRAASTGAGAFALRASAFIGFFLCTAAAAPAPDSRSGSAKGAAETPPAIEWLPWTEEVFARARKEDRGVLLTIVGPWCRSCLAAEEGIFGDPSVRRNTALRWIPVRVDREDRPDIDSRYQIVMGALTQGRSGWPVTAFLFPTGEAIWVDLAVGTEDHQDEPGFRSLLVRMDEFWRGRFQEARGNALFALKPFEEEKKPRRAAAAPLDVFGATVDGVVGRSDALHGGFGQPPRYSNPYAAELMLLAAERRRDPGLRDLALTGLRAAVRGALHDRIGGGFHRVARDESWRAPWFDKSLSVNAAYLGALAEAVRATGATDMSEAAGGTIDYILGTLAVPEGGFRASQGPSADPRDDTSYYTWLVDEARALLPAADLPWARSVLGFDEQGEVLFGLPPRFVLRAPATVEEAARASGTDVEAARAGVGRILRALAASRAARPAPPVPPARYLDSTALACSALLRAGTLMGRDDAVAAALKALDRILAENKEIQKGIPHRLDAEGRSGSPVLMADLAYLGNALVDAHDAGGSARHLEAAKKVAASIRALFLDEEGGGFYDVTPQPEAAGYLRLRRKVLADYIQPSPQAAAVRLLDGLADRTRDESWRTGVEGALAWVATHLLALDERAATVALAIDAHIQPRVRITVAGEGSRAESMVSAALALYEPGRIIERLPGAPSSPPTATVCVGGACREGVVDPASLGSVLTELRAAARKRGGSVAAP